MNRLMIPNLRMPPAFGGLAGDMEELMNRVWSGGEGLSREYLPQLDIVETEDSFEVSVDLPGVKPEDVRVELEEDHLTISGRRESIKKDHEKNFHRVERVCGEFGRTVLLPKAIDADAIEASYQDGVLHVRLPKSVKERSRRIEIKSGQSGSAEGAQHRKKDGKATA